MTNLSANTFPCWPLVRCPAPDSDCFMEGCKLHPVPGSAPVLLTTSNCHTRHPLTSSGVPALVQQHSLLTKHVLKTIHFVNSHFADSILSSDWSTVTILCSDWSTVSAKCEFTKCVVFSTCSAPIRWLKTLTHLKILLTTL